MFQRRALPFLVLSVVPFRGGGMPQRSCFHRPREHRPSRAASPQVQTSAQAERSFTGIVAARVQATWGSAFQGGSRASGRYRADRHSAAKRSCASIRRTSGSPRARTKRPCRGHGARAADRGR
jgi:hypothetical protein